MRVPALCRSTPHISRCFPNNSRQTRPKPTVFRNAGFRFFFCSNEVDPREPVHIHVMKDGHEAKCWLGAPAVFARAAGFDARTLRLLAGLVAEYRNLIDEAWHEHFRN
ncbi:MAG: DUF4160 domain-containing protein [Sulfitobacter sp.]